MGIDKYFHDFQKDEHGGPNFHWNRKNATTKIVNRVKEVINSITTTTSSPFTTQTEISDTTIVTTGVPEATSASTFSSIPNETTSEMLSIQSTTEFFEEMSSNNRTVIDEMVGSNRTVGDGGEETTTLASVVTDIMETTISTTKDVIENATEMITKVMNYGTTTVQNTNIEIDDNFNQTSGKNDPYDSIEDNTLYIILGAALGIIILLIFILLAIYVKYKCVKWRSTSGAYCITNLREISTSEDENMKKSTVEETKSINFY